VGTAITGVGGVSETGCTWLGVFCCCAGAGLVGALGVKAGPGLGFTDIPSGESIPLLQPRRKIAAPTPTPPATNGRVLIPHVYRARQQRSSDSQRCNHEDLGPLNQIAQQ
jgi:hypothetical protein